MNFFSLVLIILITNIFSKIEGVDFYELLKVNKKASPKEIKESYKEIVKKIYHDDPSNFFPTSKLALVNEAFKTLYNNETRSLYDVFGKSSSDLDFFLGHQVSGHDFQLGSVLSSSLFQLPIVDKNLYDKKIKTESKERMQVIFVLGEECENCPQLLSQTWIQWCHQLILDGVACYQMNKSFSSHSLLRRLRAPSSFHTAVVSIVDSRAHWLHPIPQDLHILISFLLHSFPRDLTKKADSENLNSFLKEFRSIRNHVTLVLFCICPVYPPLPFLTSLFSSKHFISGLFVHLKHKEKLLKRFQLPINENTLLVFKENEEEAAFRFSLPMIRAHHYESIIRAHPLLHVPRINCPSLFDVVCPLGSPKNRKSLCVIMLKPSDPFYESFLQSFRLFSQDYTQKERVRFSYVDDARQRSFFKLFNWDSSPVYDPKKDSLKVIIGWRKDKQYLNFDLLEEGWVRGIQGIKRSRRKLTQQLDWILSHPSSLPNTIQLKGEVQNEHLPSIWYRILMRLASWWQNMNDFFLGIENSTYFFIIKSVLFICACAVVMRYMMIREEKMLMENGEGGIPSEKNHLPTLKNPSPLNQKPVIYIHMLCPSNYKELFVESPSEVRLLLLLVDDATKEKMIQFYGSYLQPYARSKAFKFACLNLDKYFWWYKELLDLTMRLSDHYEKVKSSFNLINIKNCVGTVLAVNGIKKYYSMYHISYFKQTLKGTNANMATKLKCSDDEEEEEEDEEGDESIEDEEKRIGIYSKINNYSNNKENSDNSNNNNNKSMTLVKRKGFITNNLENDSKENILKNHDNNSSNNNNNNDKYFESDLLRGLERWLDKLVSGKLKKFRIGSWPRTMIPTGNSKREERMEEEE